MTYQPEAVVVISTRHGPNQQNQLHHDLVSSFNMFSTFSALSMSVSIHGRFSQFGTDRIVHLSLVARGTLDEVTGRSFTDHGRGFFLRARLVHVIYLMAVFHGIRV